MSELPNELRYTRTHEWIRKGDDGLVTIGITDHAQELLGDMVYIELPEVGAGVTADSDCAVVESVKAASDVYAPLDGEVVETNPVLDDSPDLVNKDPYGDGWLFRMKPADEAAVDAFMDADAYAEMIAAES